MDDAPTVTLVTGFPRQLARIIAAQVLEADPRATVALLARSRHLDDAARFAARPECAGRVTVVEGDVTSIDLGLDGAEYLSLAARVTALHHAAVSATEAADGRAAQHLNVQGARETITFARACAELRGAAPRVVHYGSVAAAAGVRERVCEAPIEGARTPRDPVAASLRRAEDLFARAWDDVPSTLLRASTMVGHSQTGEVDLLDGLYLVVLLMMSAPRELVAPLPLPEGTTLNVVPVDFVGRAGVALGLDPRAARRVVHVVDPSPLSARRAMELLAQTVGRRAPRGIVPVNITRALLRTPGVEGLLKSPRAFAERIAGRVHYEGEAARTLLAPRDLRCPPFESYVDALVDHVRERLAGAPGEGTAATDYADDPLL